MIRILLGLFLVILGAGAIDTSAELMNPANIGDDTESWMLFTILNAIGLPLMMWGVLDLNR
tara:strand:+ start:336 stop:518 length:183 start_codon:yes stop_codon:yes gene_type:complete